MGDLKIIDEKNSCITLVFSIIFAIGLIGNLVVIIFTLSYKKSKPVAKTVSINLAIADFLVVFVCLPKSINKLYNLFDWVLEDYSCRLSVYIQGLALTLSILTLTLTSIDKYMIICKPFSVRTFYTLHKVNSIIVFIWLFSVVINIPLLLNTRAYPYNRVNGSILHTSSQCCSNWNNTDVKIIFFIIQMIFLFFIPLVLITITTVCVSKKLCRRKQEFEISLKTFKQRNERSRSLTVSIDLLDKKYSINSPSKSIKSGYEKQCESRKKIVVPVIVSFILFIILWIPYYVFFFISEMVVFIGNKSNLKIDDSCEVKFINENISVYPTFLASSNSTFNGILFCLFNSGFRRMVTSLKTRFI